MEFVKARGAAVSETKETLGNGNKLNSGRKTEDSSQNQASEDDFCFKSKPDRSDDHKGCREETKENKLRQHFARLI